MSANGSPSSPHGNAPLAILCFVIGDGNPPIAIPGVLISDGAIFGVIGELIGDRNARFAIPGFLIGVLIGDGNANEGDAGRGGNPSTEIKLDAEQPLARCILGVDLVEPSLTVGEVENTGALLVSIMVTLESLLGSYSLTGFSLFGVGVMTGTCFLKKLLHRFSSIDRVFC